MSDPVAENSTFLCMYMSNYPDTLVAYVKYWGEVSEPVGSARMTSIDSKGMTLEYKGEGKGKDDSRSVEKYVRVVFDPPLAGYEEVKRRLLRMAADAQESLGMTKVPQITSFELPPDVPLILGPPLFLIIYTLVSQRHTGPQWDLGHWLFRKVFEPKVFKGFWIIAGVLHVLEALYVQRLCVKHRTGFSVGFKYVLSTFLFGVTVLVPLRKKIQRLRIDSILKVN